MTCRSAGSGLMFAGLIVTLVGLAVALAHTFEIPRYWTTVAVGIALLAAGAFRSAVGGRRQPDSGAS
ncbi:MAG TPA: hypothetical protein VGT02_17255 [Methylomirabilota bacterium]|jgi:hypothetical protein|nr:hypothetical protein [Methylomirabilota bacterium]